MPRKPTPYAHALEELARAKPSPGKSQFFRIMRGMFGDPEHEAEYAAFLESPEHAANMVMMQKGEGPRDASPGPSDTAATTEQGGSKGSPRKDK